MARLTLVIAINMENLFSVLDYKVWFATAITWFIGLADANGILTALATIVTIAYTVHKWYLIVRKDEDK